VLFRSLECVVVADVSDKGVPAALFMAAARNLVRHQAAESSDPAEVVTGVNRTLCEDTERFASMFVTLFFGSFDPRDRRFRFANAGHCPALWLPKGGEPVWLSSEGTVLGQFPEARYVGGEVAMSPGDLLVLYTDGITEAAAPDGTMFRRDGLLETVLESREWAPRELAARILERVREFSGAGGVGDDLTVVIGRVDP
jgi:sigma-B regulation protein RsbU (phosphoserine phosphatase)